MPCKYESAESLEKLPAVGTKQCVALVKHYAGTPPSSLWQEGEAVRGNPLDGRYPKHGSGNHAAFFISQDVLGIVVVDQWRSGGTIRKRTLPFLGKDSSGDYIRTRRPPSK